LNQFSSQFDVVVVGSGAAGLYAALCLPESYRVGLITKDKLKTGASDWAQGGIAAAIAPDDSSKLHFEDTLKAGAGLCIPEAVQFLVDNAAAAIASLVEMGVAFDRHHNELAMTLEAAHSRPRVLHAADTTGRAIVTTLTEQVLARPNIEVISGTLVLNVWRNPQTGVCQGISAIEGDRLSWIEASAVILATGGGGQVFSHTTNPQVSTGDGVAIAARAGAILRDLEFFQFHPTALTKANAPHFLISEAVRGEGAHLIDLQGKRFAFDYHPDGELAPRDIVSRAIYSHLQKTQTDRVYLDLTPIPIDRIRYRFPNIIQVCQHWGIDVFKEPIPVAPAAHYWMGGVAVDTMNRTSIPGLYAIGETASTGVHGANRLASNSLLECVVYAAQLSKIEGVGSREQGVGSREQGAGSREQGAGEQGSRGAEEQRSRGAGEQGSRGAGEQGSREAEEQGSREAGEQGSRGAGEQLLAISFEGLEAEIELIASVRKELPDLVWKSAGICRSQPILEQAIEQIQAWRTKLVATNFYQTLFCASPQQEVQFNFANAAEQLKLCAETFNLLDIAYLILKSAAFRTESRGGHYRTDYPQTEVSWQVHTLVEKVEDEFQWQKSSN
jgi:L-aspartate oxidase